MDTREIKKEYLEKFDGLIGDVQENKTDKFVTDLVWSFIESSLLAYRKEVIEEVKSLIKSMPAEVMGDRIYVDYRHLMNNFTILSKDTRKKKE